jgi:hypothetical protein
LRGSKKRILEGSMAKKPVRTAKPQTAFSCGLLGLTPRGLEGWASDPDRPAASVAIEVEHGGSVLGTFLANRIDVAVPPQLQVPPGHGFVVQLEVPPASLKLPATIKVRVANSEQVVGSVQVETPAQLAWFVSEYVVGHLDALQGGRLVGWAVDMKQPAKPLKVELLVSGERYGETTCSIFRPDVKRSGIGDGMCGFSFALPDVLLDGRLHEIKVRVEGAEMELGPLLFGPASFSELAQQVAQFQAKLAAIEKQLALLCGPSGKLYRDIEESLLRRHEALMEIHRELVEGELVQLRKGLTASGTAAPRVAAKAPATPRRRR